MLFFCFYYNEVDNLLSLKFQDFPIASYVKLISCVGCHLEYPIDRQINNLFKDSP